MNFFALWKKVKLLFLKWSWFDWKSRHHGYLETKATLKVKKTVDLKIMVLLSFLKSGRQENHIISKISICTIFNSSCSFRMERKTEAFFQLSCSFPPADKVEERGLAVASIISLFGISYTK